MKAMLLAFVTLGVVSVGAYLILNEAGFSSQERGSGAAVRLDD
ncbi:hypothetical protein [uncultured Tateyamaria sp.]|nr:hypothetical protein [uncultured Tateyamaria sp.]